MLDNFPADIVALLNQRQEKAISHHHPHLLNAFEHITAMEWTQALKKLDYADYFVRRNVSFEDDYKTMNGVLNFFHKTIIKKIT